MSNFDHLRDFIKIKLAESHLDKKELGREIDVSDSTLAKIFSKKPYKVNKVINFRPFLPSLKSLLEIANYFNCSLDEMIGRKKFVPNQELGFQPVSLDEATTALRTLIKDKLVESKIGIVALSNKCGFSKDTFAKFIKETNPNAALSMSAVIALVDYCNVSLDDVIGRKSSVIREKVIESQRPAPATTTTPKLLEGLNEKDLHSIETIRKAGVNQPPHHSRDKQHISQASKPSRDR